jgi:ABC-2 type transport system ATP-binding protein
MRQPFSSISPETGTDQPGWQTTGGDMARHDAQADSALTAGAHASGVAKVRREPGDRAQGESRPTSASRAETVSSPAVEISHLRKTYGPLVAVDDVSFSVTEGEIFGILGPNGAGKTTTVECAIGLRSPDSGTIRLMGIDPQADKAQIHQIAGVQLQSGAFPPKLRVGEIIEMYRSFYRHPADVGELTGALGLADKGRSYYRSLSGGQQQRLSVVLALVGAPKIAVLDEMTTGLDPQARRDAWELLERVRDRGTTVLLVTHFMEEAERLCDRVALIDSGRIIALDTPAGLVAQATGAKTVRFLPSAPFDESLLTRLPEVTGIEHEGQHVTVTGTGELATAVIVAMHAAGIEARDVRTDASTLEDAFVNLTGRHLREAHEGAQS